MPRFKELKTVRPPPGAFDAIEQAIRALLKREMYRPLVEALTDEGVAELWLPKNAAIDDLVQALAAGRIQWVDGHIEGKLSPVISSALRTLGATWDGRNQRWNLSTEKLTPDLRMAMGQATSQFRKIAQRFDAALDRLSPTVISDNLKLGKVFDATLFRVDSSFVESVKAVTVQPKITAQERDTLSRRYQTDMTRYIKEWSEAEIIKLRGLVQKESMHGVRYDNLARILEDSYGASKAKARFLARQETNLFLSEFKQTRYARAGISEYIWKCVAGSPLHPVRPDHKELNNTKQRWDTPPLTDRKRGTHNHPGEDFGCRCYDRPVIKF